MDTPWLYIYTAHKLNQHQRHTLQLTSELTASKWLTIRNLLLEGFYRDRDREKEARLKLYTPAVTYIQVRSGHAAPSEHLIEFNEMISYSVIVGTIKIVHLRTCLLSMPL